MEIIIFWILLAIVPAAIASGKGRSGPAWFFLGLLISPLIAAVIAAVISEKDQTKKAIRAGEMKKCPDCAEPIRAEANVCRYCGKRFD